MEVSLKKNIDTDKEGRERGRTAVFWPYGENSALFTALNFYLFLSRLSSGITQKLRGATLFILEGASIS